MGNHFHVLVEVPERPGKEPPDGELLEHLGLIYGVGRLAGIRRELEQCRGQGDHGAAAALRERYLRRIAAQARPWGREAAGSRVVASAGAVFRGRPGDRLGRFR